MITRTTRLGLLAATLAIVASACSGSATPTPAPSAAPSVAAPSVAASVAPSPSAAPSASTLKIGVVTDLGTLNDKGFNEYSYKGAVDAATALGAASPSSIVPKDSSEYKTDIQQLADQKFDVIVTIGFNMTAATEVAAKANPTIHFVGVDESPICVDPTGAPDSTFACKGDPKTLLPNFTSVYFAEDQAGYLVGIVAAYASKANIIGAIGGTTLCASCVRFIQGYELGAKSVKPSIVVKSSYVTHDFSAAAFSDPAGGKIFADTFIKTNKVDVLFQVAGATGNGVLEAACASKIYGIGVNVDQWVSLGAPANACLITSAEKRIETAVNQAVTGIAAGSLAAGDVLYNAANDGIAASPFHDKAGMFGPEVQAALDAALAAMKAGTLQTCPTTGCGVAP
ncbi:MAG TPA: BMP family ABC transporter substrate-binding protein [Cellulomonadaceae bacterium]|nr:BMP family ABC transporter substrate-binding protein [Cellulomonadaceae bacterium]